MTSQEILDKVIKKWNTDPDLNSDGWFRSGNVWSPYTHWERMRLHRTEGPAVYSLTEYNDRNVKGDYYLHGVELTKEQWFEQLTSEQKSIALFNEENW